MAVIAPSTSAWRRRVVVGAGGLAVVVVAFVLGQQVGGDGDGEAPAQPPASEADRPPATELAGFVTHRDDEAGFSLRYPEEWRVLSEADGELRLLLGAGGLDSLLVRVIRLEEPVDAGNIGDVKSVTDAIVQGADVRILQERAIEVNGLGGYYYLYTFTDSESGTEGVHAHYFLFQGRKMNVLVFQALPSEGFADLAPTFDAIAESFRSDPDS